ncbi:hypothetical protein CC78DRAFT_577245 [Lojkania enalia]|uniref:Uncharacterized protein n=1 Tax=Lojkania enalia TaxID=147567 RepID=A0A9P4KDM5_9PLEO|nr:hypothetical protein CC78DRAFT_577245 [Didymosphaeria enalia]
MKSALQRYPTMPVAGPGEGEHGDCPGGTKCERFHNIDVHKDIIRKSIQRISSKVFLPDELARIKECGSEPALSAKRAAHRILRNAKYYTLAAKTVELYQELIQAEGRQFCTYTLASMLANLSGEKLLEPKGPSRAHSMPIDAGRALGHFGHVDMPRSILDELTNNEAGNPPPPAPIQTSFYTGSKIQCLEGSNKTWHPHGCVMLAGKDPHVQDIEKSLEHSLPDPNDQTNTAFYFGLGALTLAGTAAVMLLCAKKLPRRL